MQTAEQMSYCINCDNRHGCKSGTPPCIGEMVKHGITDRSGKRYLTETGPDSAMPGVQFLPLVLGQRAIRSASVRSRYSPPR